MHWKALLRAAASNPFDMSEEEKIARRLKID
jgi:hypothetical protein